jgi:3-oxoacyl-[acyl-carrier-protein] synthase I
MSNCTVSNVGIVTSLGHDAPNSCAAARAGLNRQSPLDVKNFAAEEKWEGGLIYGHCVPAIGRGFVGVGKVLVLGEAALRDLLNRIGANTLNSARTGLFLLLSDSFVVTRARRAQASANIAGGDVALDGKLITATLLERVGLSIGTSSCHVTHGGHAEFLRLLEAACRTLVEKRYDQCIVGAIDSNVEPAYLEAAAELLMLRTEAYPAGFIPGEAAGFLLIQRQSQPSATPTQVRIGALAIADEGGTYLDEVKPSGRKLAEVIQRAFAARGTNREGLPGAIIGDLNGWEVPAADWGNAVIRLLPGLDIAGTPVWLPAASFGETGAASGVLAIAMATEAFRRGYAPGDSLGIWLASISGLRGALVLHAS